MKKFTAFLLSLLALSCQPVKITPEEPETEAPELSEDEVLVSFKPELEFTDELMTKSGSVNDLYGIRVYSWATINDFVSSECVAFGQFDDLDNVVIKLSKNKLYGVDMVYIPDGKNLIYQHGDGTYGVPFDPVWYEGPSKFNEVMYYTPGDGAVWSFGYGATQEKGISDYRVQSNDWSTVKRYQGSVLCNPTESGDVVVKLRTTMVGFHLEVTDFPEGKVTISSTHGHKYSVEPNADDRAVLDIEVCRSSLPVVADGGCPYSEFVSYEDLFETLMNHLWDERVIISYTDSDNSEIILYDKSGDFLPGHRYNLSFSLSDAVANKGISAVVEETEVIEEDFPL